MLEKITQSFVQLLIQLRKLLFKPQFIALAAAALD
jgi:hypothetical protein